MYEGVNKHGQPGLFFRFTCLFTLKLLQGESIRQQEEEKERIEREQKARERKKEKAQASATSSA